MAKLIDSPPYTRVEPVTDVLHGVPITDPYRWLEEQESPQTRAWLAAQTEYARSYLDAIPGRDRIKGRVRELLDVESYDSLRKAGSRYFFRKRLPAQEQPCIFVREGRNGPDQILIDPMEHGTGNHTAVGLLCPSPDGRLLLYEVKEGGERAGTFHLLDIQSRKTLPDVLPRGYLRGFAFAHDCESFYYVHEAVAATRPRSRTAYHHVLGTSFDDDREIFFAGEGENVRLHIVPGKQHVGFLVYRFLDPTRTDFYLWEPGTKDTPEPLIRDADYKFAPYPLNDGRILAITDRDATNFRIVEVRRRVGQEPDFVDVIGATDSQIQGCVISEDRIYVAYVRGTTARVDIFDHSGEHLGRLPTEQCDTVRLTGSSPDGGELFFEQESFTKPIQTCLYSVANAETELWGERKTPFEHREFGHSQVWFTGEDGTRIPMYLVGRRDVLAGGSHPAVMTSYGGYGVPMTPRFSVFVAFLMERGCLFALPNIRGGSEFGGEWHSAAKRRNRQVAFNDFMCAAEWLVETGRTEPRKFAIFGGSNSGLLVGAALTQRPDLFRAVVCMVPILDMLRYHLFDNANAWIDEFGTAADPDDFVALHRYSPYHRVRDGVSYPAIMLVSGDRDQNCNSLHARKMTARLQAANVSEHPILLDYSPYRGHSPVLPFSTRVEALTDRMAFLCDQLGLPR